jgi:hypothetical protein
MTRKLSLLTVVLAALALAGNTYTVTLFQPSTVAGADLKPGDYKLTLDGGKAIFEKGKQKVEAAVKTEDSTEKFSTTTVRYANTGGKFKVLEIRLGGTRTKLVFAD